MSDYDLGFSDCLREQECLQAEIEHERDLLKSEVERLKAENDRLRLIVATFILFADEVPRGESD
jgi:hypothetical protein